MSWNNVIPAHLLIDTANIKPKPPVENPSIFIPEDMVTDLHMAYTWEGSYNLVAASEDHPAFARVRKMLEAQGFISIWKEVCNGDRVLKRFRFNGFQLEVGDKFLSAAAWKTNIYIRNKLMNKIKHNPHLDVSSIAKFYSEKDGVPVKYVCTSATNGGSSSMDIFYRDTPHPKFGNRYFGIYTYYTLDGSTELRIANADKIESVSFDTVEVDGEYHYSQDRHDYRVVKDVAIDGGRSYLRRVGNLDYPVRSFVLRNGFFIEKEYEE